MAVWEFIYRENSLKVVRDNEDTRYQKNWDWKPRALNAQESVLFDKQVHLYDRFAKKSIYILHIENDSITVDNGTGPISSWANVTDLLDALEEVFFLANGGGSGETGSSGLIGLYKAATTTQTPPPTSGHVLWNNANQTLATKVFLSKTTDDGKAFGNVLNAAKIGDELFLFAKSDSDTFQRWDVTAITDNTNDVEYDVTLIEQNKVFTSEEEIRFQLIVKTSVEDIPDNSITFSKIQQIVSNVLLGRWNTGTGNVETIAIGDGLELDGDTLKATNTTKGWDGEVLTRNDLPITTPEPAVGEVYLVQTPISETVLGVPYRTYQSGLYIRDFLNGNLNDWRRLNVKVQFTDAEFRISDADNTGRQFRFDAGLLTSGSVRTLTAQDKDYTIAGLDDITLTGLENIGAAGVEIFKSIVNKLGGIRKLVGVGGTTVALSADGNSIEISTATINPASIGRALTTYGGNINQAAFTIIPFDNLGINDNNDFSIGPNGGIVLEREGSVELFCKMSFDDGGNNNQRLQLQIQFAVNGVLAGAKTHDSYLRDSSGATTSECKLREFFASLSQGDEITVLCRRISTANNAINVIIADTYFDCIIRNQISLTTPNITDPIEGQIIEFFQLVPGTYQSVAEGLTPLWQLTGSNTQFTIDNGGLITYDGTGATGDFADTISAINSAGQDDVNVIFRVLSNPFNIAGYSGHYRAEDIVVGDGSPVATWSDVSPNGNDLTQGTVSSQPLFDVNYGDYPAVVFDGLQDRIFNNTLFIPSTTQCLLCVVRTNSTILNRIVMGTTDISNRATMIINDTNLGDVGGSFTGSLSSSPNIVSTSVNDNDWHVVVVRHNGITTSISVDGGAPVDIVGAIAASNIVTFSLGSIGFGGSFYEGGIAESLFYTQNLTDPQLTTLVNFLKSKYNIA